VLILILGCILAVMNKKYINSPQLELTGFTLEDGTLVAASGCVSWSETDSKWNRGMHGFVL